MAIESDSSSAPYLQVAAKLRAGIVTKKFKPGEKLPSQHELAEQFGVSRMTIQNALRTLKEDGLIVARQGSGAFVRERSTRPIGLRPHIEQAFEASEVTIDFTGYTSETLHGILQEPIGRIREGALTPRRIDVRLLLADVSGPVGMPALKNQQTPEHEAALKRRMARIIERSALAIRDDVQELGWLGLVASTSVQIRTYRSAPVFKCYILNDRELFHGLYPIVTHDVDLNGTKATIYDPMGKDAEIFHHYSDNDPDNISTQYVEQYRMWFNSVWGTVARDYQP